MLIITTIYFAHLESDKPDAGAKRAKRKTHRVSEIIKRKLTKEADANRKLVIVYAGTNRVPDGDA
jgi:hypothetical protein